MNKYRFVRLAARVSVVVVPALAACAATTDEPASTEINPQRSPEEWSNPNAPGSPSDGPSADTPQAPGAPDAPETPDAPKTPDTPEGTPPKNEPAAGDPVPIAGGPVPYRGINLAGAEFGNALPGADGKDYTFPNRGEVDYYMSKGMNTFRVGFKWERMQHSANGPFDAAYSGKLESIVTYATSKGATVILNPHNFARYYGETVGSSKVPSSVFADFWSKLSKQYKADTKVMFNLVNEPHDMPTEQWVFAANAAIAAIRDAGAGNVIIVPGNSWTGAHSWYSNSYGTPNATAMLKIEDPKDNVVFEVHQYMDSNSSGGGGACVSTAIGRERLTGFVKWLRDNGKKGFLGEFAGGNNSTCSVAVKNMLDYVHESSDVFIGWTWWAGGPWWGDYQFTLDPKDGKDRPQMAWLTPYLKK